jgi:plastocyanin
MTNSPKYRAVVALLAMLVLAVALAGCTANQGTAPQSTGTAAPAAPAAGPGTITIRSFAFSPQEITVAQGTTVTWTNQDSAPHTITSDTGAPEAISSDSLSQGASFSFTFTKPGTYPYHCSIHPSMKGTIIVTS